MSLRPFFILAFACLLACGQLTSQDQADLAAYKMEQSKCVLDHEGDDAAIASCRHAVHDKWAKRWNDRFHGGFE